MTIDYLVRYVAEVPMSFALSRAVECKVLAKTPMEPPVLDLGCGDGLFARIFFEGTPVDVGIDVAVNEARRAKAAGAYKDVVLATGAALPFADSSFHTILSNSVLEHVVDLPVALRECYRILEPGGKIVVTVPLTRLSDCFFYSNVLRKLGARRAAASYSNWKHRIWHHYNVFDEEGWASALVTAGFQIDRLFLFNSWRTAQLSDLLFPLSPPSLVSKKLSGHLVLRPAFWSRVLARLLRGTYEQDGVDGMMSGTICLVATKNSGADA